MSDEPLVPLKLSAETYFDEAFDTGSVELPEIELEEEHFAELWQLFTAIHLHWGNDAHCRVEDMASRWREFIHEKASGPRSYLKEYLSACELLRELREASGDDIYEELFFDRQRTSEPGSREARLKKFVIDEFIRVYVSSGGFRTYGGRNYGGFVSGSRYRSRPPFRTSGKE